MSKNVIHITDLGLQAANNAKHGGVLVNLLHFKLGDSSEVTRDTDIDIVGETLYQGFIHLIETLDSQTARFTMEVPEHAIPEDGMTIYEIGLFMEDGILFGRCVFESPYFLHPNRSARIYALLVTTRMDVSILNVTVGELSSVPSAANVYRLPSPETSQFNILSVLDALDNIDGTSSPAVAMKFGAGSLQWAFSNYERVFSGNPDPSTSPSSFTQRAITSALTFIEGETVIVYVVSGNARGASRKFRYVAGTDTFVEKDGQPIDGFDSSSHIVIWRRINSASVGGAIYPPAMVGVPDDWVLTRGVGNVPVWAPPKNTGKNLNTLYISPGKLVINSINNTGTGRESRYSIGNFVLRDVNHCVAAIGGVTQHKSAYDISGSELEFADTIPPHATIDLRLLTKEPGNGSFTDIITDSFKGDGATREFRISSAIEESSYAFVYIRGLLQSTTAYTYNAATQSIVFVSAPDAGIDIEVSSFVSRPEKGYSTTVVSSAYITIGDTLFFELPVEPQSKDFTFVSVSGTHIHRNLYNVIDNKIVLSSPARGGLEIEILVFENVRSEGTPQTNLSGIVTDAVLTSKSLKLLRHDAHPVVLPIPTIDLVSGKGIRISGRHPVYKVESTIANEFSEATNFKFSTLRRLEDSEEIIYTYRVQVSSDIMIQVTVDFAAVLGPGFVSIDGTETMQYVIGFRTTSVKEPDYGREIKGTGEAGFSSLSSMNNQRAFSNASLTQVFDLIQSNIPAGYIDVISRMRVRNANISKYGSKLSMNFNVIGTPIIR